VSNADGNTGVGYVCFTNPKEALNAIAEMSSAIIDDKSILHFTFF